MNKVECKTFEDWELLHKEVLPDCNIPNSIKGIRQRIQRVEGLVKKREPVDYSFNLNEQIASGEIDLTTISFHDIAAANITRGSSEVTDIKSFDQRVEQIRKQLNDMPHSGTIYQNGSK